ncbi:RNase adaptor protein RapZ, partial [Rhodospirillum rubrum]|nr:RNase adaptor protein RapZ [Rhodospirillum rubrum]
MKPRALRPPWGDRHLGAALSGPSASLLRLRDPAPLPTDIAPDPAEA